MTNKLNSGIMHPAEQVLVLMAKNERRLNEREWEHLLRQFPLCLQQKTMQLHRWEDRQASLFGKVLLLKGLASLREDPRLIHTMQWDQYKRPFVAGDLDFNIAHAGELVVCALLKGGRVGVDVEAVEPIDIPDYKGVFTEQEYQSMIGAPRPLFAFYDFWTRKEALMKADGRGFYLDPKTFDATLNDVRIADRWWRVKKMAAPEHYVCHLALPGDTPVAFRFLEMGGLL